MQPSLEQLIDTKKQFKKACQTLDIATIKNLLENGFKIDSEEYHRSYEELLQDVHFDFKHTETADDFCENEVSQKSQEIFRLLIKHGLNPDIYLRQLPEQAESIVDQRFSILSSPGLVSDDMNTTSLKFLMELGAYKNFAYSIRKLTTLDYFDYRQPHQKPSQCAGMFPSPKIIDWLRSEGCKLYLELSEDEKEACEELDFFYDQGFEYLLRGVALKESCGYRLHTADLHVCLSVAAANYYATGETRELDYIWDLCQRDPYFKIRIDLFTGTLHGQLKNEPAAGSYPDRANEIWQRISPFIPSVLYTSIMSTRAGDLPPRSGFDWVIDTLPDLAKLLQERGDLGFEELQRKGLLVPYAPERGVYAYALDL